MRQAELFVQADQVFNNYISKIADNWDKVVPSTPEWTVRKLVDHVAKNNLTLIGQLSGTPINLPDDALGNDPVTSWTEGAERAEELANEQMEPSRQIAGPMGDITIGEILLGQTADRTLHAWDLAHALDEDENIEPGLVQAVYDVVAESAESARAAGVFGPAIGVGPDASLLQRLLALTGRDSGYHHEEPNNDSNTERANEIHRGS